LGPVSSAFNFLTFYVLLAAFHAHETLFRSGWFVESLATVLVIFVIRTRGPAFAGFLAVLVALVAVYLFLAEAAKWAFYRLRAVNARALDERQALLAPRS
jgi:xanthine/uracil permease